MELEPDETELGVLTREDFGDAWPLTVPFVLVVSRPVQVPGRSLTAATFITPDGVRYAVNGSATAHTPFRVLEPTDPVWANHPYIAGLKKDISPIIDACRNLGAA